MTHVIEYKCPCCDAGLKFDGISQQLTCEYCGNAFALETVQAYNEAPEADGEIIWEALPQQEWSQPEQAHIHAFQCPSCGGELLTEETTAATFCPYCDNPAVLPSRLSGGLKPDALIPFATTKEDAKTAFLKLCQGKPLLPKLFTQEQQLEKITGLYVPFWLFDCRGDFDGSYKATRTSHWSDSRYHYTKTDHFLLKRTADAAFVGIPIDGSQKMDDAFMESIEPFDYGALTAFDTAYLTGFFADKYDVSSESGGERIRQRVDASIHDLLQSSFLGYTTVLPTSRNLKIDQGKARYVLLPVWLLNTRYQDKLYTFAMNGQTGKMTGTFPICPKRTAAWFAGVFAGAAALCSLIQLLF